VFLGRFVSVLRTYAAFLAGTNRMHWRRFLPWNAAGGIIWAAIYTFTFYAVGNAIKKATGPVDIALGAAAIVAVFLVICRQTGRLTARAETAYSGALTDH